MTTPTNPDLTEGDATTMTGQDRVEDILKRQRAWMTTLSLPCTSFSTMFRLDKVTQDPQERAKTQEDGLELLQVAMWVTLTQCLAGRTCLLVHLAQASSWNAEMVSLVAGLEGVILVTVDMCALGMADVEGRLHRKTTTNMTNAQVVANVFRPYRCTRDHEHAPSVGAWRTRRDPE